MTTFLSELADYLLDKHQSQFRDVTVVLPGKRSGIFLKRELTKRGYHGWLPKITTLSELFADMAKMKRGDALDLTFELFICHQKRSSKEESFEAFLQWGSTLLADFNEVDHYLIGAKTIFKNIKDFKDIEEWSFGEDDLTETQQKFAGFWETLLPLYNAFHLHMDQIGLHYGGAIARKVASDPVGMFKATQSEYLIVAGLNALTKAEQKVIKSLQDRELCTVFWDADNYYVQQKKVEAGHFIRQMLDLGNAKRLPANFLGAKKTINVVGSSSTVNQMQYIYNELAKSDGDATEIGIVLPDNSVLPSLLPSIPEQFDSINVTMGESLAHTQYKSLCNAFFRLFDVNGKKLRYAALLSFLRHPLLNQKAERPMQGIEKFIIKNNLVFIGAQDLKAARSAEFDKGKFGTFLAELYKAVESRTIEDVLDAFKLLLVAVRPFEALKEGDNQGWKRRKVQSWNLMQSLVVKLARLTSVYPMLEGIEKKNRIRALERIMMKLLGKLQIDLKGEPLKGLQIMGLLESRALDFKKVFILSGNEGVVPKQSFTESMIPSEIRYGFGLPTRFDRDAIFAYYYYRLIQRAEEVHLLYTSGESSHLTGEKSRYIQQLESCHLLADAGSKPISKSIRSSTPKHLPVIPEIQESEWAKKRLDQLLESGLSPSALNKWIACPADFYFRYILGLREQDDVEEEMESSTFGSMIHEVLEKGLQAEVGKQLTVEALKKLKTELIPRMDDALTEVRYRKELTTSGVNYLSKKVAIRYLEKLLDKEIEVVAQNKVELVDLEQSFEKEVSFQEGTRKALIKGKADRIDRFNGTLRIVDYKSGKVSGSDLNLADNWKDQLQSSKKSKALQTLIYAILARFKFNEDALAGIISTRNFTPGFMSVTYGRENTPLVMDQKFALDFIDWLSERLDEISSGSKAILHSEDSLYCEYCVDLKV